MRSFILSVAVATAVLVGAPHGATAAPVLYTIESSASGTLNGINFTNAAITLIGSGDTTGINHGSGGSTYFQNTLTSLSFTLAGVGSGTITTPIAVFANQALESAGLLPLAGGTLMIIYSPAFAASDLSTDIGPVASTFVQTSCACALDTSIGQLVIDGGSFLRANFVTDAAPFSSVPEPASLALLCAGLFGLGWPVARRASDRGVGAPVATARG